MYKVTFVATFDMKYFVAAGITTFSKSVVRVNNDV